MHRNAPLVLLFVLVLGGCPDARPGPPAGDVDAGPRPDAGPEVDSSVRIEDDAGSAAVDAEVGPSCPPAGPYGTNVGDVAPELVLMDCDGVERSLHALCGAPAAWVFEFAGWCPPCIAFAEDHANEVHASFSPRGVEGYLVISETDSSGPPTLAYCQQVREAFGLTMPVLIDPEGLLQRQYDAPSNSYSVVMGEGNVIRWRAQYAEELLPAQLEAALAAVSS